VLYFLSASGLKYVSFISATPFAIPIHLSFMTWYSQ
jgi:hypothetical protein